eukprot:5545892-Alexandrium_andersonii.AAC.1
MCIRDSFRHWAKVCATGVESTLPHAIVADLPPGHGRTPSQRLTATPQSRPQMGASPWAKMRFIHWHLCIAGGRKAQSAIRPRP